MVDFLVEDKPDLTLQEDTIYRAKLVEIKERSAQFDDRQNPGQKVTRHYWDWWWEVVSDDKYSGRRVKATCPAEINSLPTNQPRIWAEALLSREIAPGTGFSSDDLLGLTADITVRHEESKDHSRIFEVVDMVIGSGDSPSYSTNDDPPF